MTFSSAALRLLAIVCLLLGGNQTASSAPGSEAGRPLSRTFLPEDYHGFEQVWHFAQTADGLIYATNYGALREFDGREWRSIPLPTSWVYKVAATPEGRLYIAGFDEFGYVERLSDGSRVYHSLLSSLPKDEPALAQVQQCLPIGNAVWWNTVDRVFRWDGRTTRVWRFGAPQRLTLHFGGKHLYVDEGGVALHRFNEASDSFEVLSTDRELCTLAQGVFDSWGHYPHVVVRGNGSVVAFDDAGVPNKLPFSLERPELARRVTAVERLHDGRLAIGTTGYGVFLLSPEGNVDLQFGTSGGVASPDISGLFEDREKGLWLGTALGAARLDPSLGVTVFDRENGAPPGVSYSLFRFQGQVFGRGDDGLYRLRPGGGFAEHAHFERVNSPLFKSNDFATHPSGLLIASDGGLLRYDGTQFVTEFPTAHPLHALYLSRSDPNVLFYSDSFALKVARWNGSAWLPESTVPHSDMDPRSLAEDADGVLWLGTPSRGVFRLTRPSSASAWSEATFERFDESRGLPEGHEWTTVRDTPLGILFVHTKGVSVCDASASRLVPAKAFDEVNRNGRYLYAFAAGNDGTLWVQVGDPTRGEKAELGGVRSVPGGGWVWTPLPVRVQEALGYLGAQEINWEAGAGGPGVLWLAGQKNVVRVDLDAISKEVASSPLTPLLRDVTLGDAMRLPLSPIEPLGLDFSRKSLRFHFVNPSLAPTGPVEFQFRMLGFNEEWSPWSERGEAVYTNLQRGRFNFEVRARSAGGPPGAAVSWRFTIRPPWWQSTIAYAAYGLGVMGVFWGVLRWRLRLEHKRRRQLENLVALRTEELQNERDRAESANQAKSMFLARMSHELRTPLHAILGYSQMLAADAKVHAVARDRLRIVRASGQHLLRLINEVLDFSKIEAGKQELKLEPFDLSVALQDVCDAQAARAAQKKLGFTLRTGALPRHVLGDSAKLRQVLENLLSNAIKFTDNGVVEMSVYPSAEVEGRWRFSVRDTGPGLSVEDSGRLFQPFAQAAQGNRASDTGTGLGLAISQRLVTLMGGRIQILSTVGEGSEFAFEIPLKEALVEEIRPGLPGRITGYEGLRRRVLAVDDVEVNRKLFVDLLAPLGFEVTVAATAEKALEDLELIRPDLLLLDLRLPGMDGLELARRVRRERRFDGMRILAASASVLGHDPREALAAGCDGFIPKPFLEEHFLARVGGLLGLAWIETPPEAMQAKASLDRVVLGQLQIAANAGDVVAMREALQRLQLQQPAAEEVARLEEALRNFDTERLSSLVAELLKGLVP